MKFKTWAVSFGIAILFMLFVNVGLETFYPTPDFSDYKSEDCPAEYAPQKMNETVSKECYRYENQKYQDAREQYEKNAFIVIFLAGLIALVGSVFIQNQALYWGFSVGGILELVFGTMAYWDSINDYFRFILLGVALAVLVYVAIKKLK